MIIYVDGSALCPGDGTERSPFKTISEAAAKALPGDEVLVAPGIYREAVDPRNSGTATKRITYRSAQKGQAHITGSEPVKSWSHVEGNIWKATIPNGVFSDYNPFTTLVSGDWFIASMIAHTGDVFLDEKSMYEVTDLEQVKNPLKSQTSWDPEFSLYTWYTEQDEEKDQTILYANFQEKDPNRENVEISVRKNCFYPSSEGIGYITLSGFKISQAATQWAPPTAYQEGMVGPHWSKGWIIEDCEIYEAKCSGISLGKYLQPNNNNKWLKWKYKDGTQTERDCICQASYEGWDKEHIGSHIIRRCDIHHCGQTGVTGNLFHHNCLPDDFTDCEKAYNSVGEDLFIEVSHGPTLVDHNLMLSDRSLKLATQGVALVHNLICGSLVSVGIGTDNGAPIIPSPRYTPYHVHHGTQIAGFMTILHGDMKFYNNIFIQKKIRSCMKALSELMGSDGNMWDDCNMITGTSPYDEYPTFEQWKKNFEGYCGMGSDVGDLYYEHLPVWASGNSYFNGARPWKKESDAFSDTENTVSISLEQKDDGWYLHTNLYDFLPENRDGIISTETLGIAFEPEQKYENPDGSPIIFNQDFSGEHRDVLTCAGPFINKESASRKVF